MLYDPPSHEPLTERPWDEDRVRAAIAAIVAETESAFDESGALARPSARPGRRAAAGRVVALPRRLGRDLGAARARARRPRRPRPRLGARRRPAGRALPGPAGLPGCRRGNRSLAADGRVRDPARRAHARPRALAGGVAARGGAGERLESLLGAHVGIAGDDDRGAGDGSPDGRPAVARRRGRSRRRSCWRSGATISGSRTSTAGRPTASALPMALPATSSRSPEVVSSILSAERRWSDGRSRRSRSTPSTRTGSASGRRRSSLPARRQGSRTQWCHGAPGNGRLARDDRAGRRAADGAAARGRRAHLARRPAPEGRPALPRHRRQRVRVPEAVRAHRRRALARPRSRIRDALDRAGRRRLVRSTAAAATRSGPAISGRPSTSGAASAATPPCRRSTTSRARRASRPTIRARRRRGSP